MVDPRDLRTPQVVLALLVVAVLVGMLGASNTSAADFSAYNTDWDGASDLRSMASGDGMEITAASEVAAYRRAIPERTVAVVLAPQSAYGQRELVRMREFVQNGGRLVVAGDRGPETNRLLRGLGVSARLDGRPLYDVRSNYRSPAMPVATEVSNRSLVANVSSLTLNYGTAVEAANTSVLVNTSEYAYIDADRDGGLGPNETLGTYAVAAAEPVGDGQVVVVGDSSAFINAMLDRPGNRAFARSLLSDRQHLLFDYSHATGLPPLQRALFGVRESAAAQLGVGGLAVAAVAVWSRRRGLEASGIPSDVLGKVPPSDVLGKVPGWFPRAWREDDPSPGVRPDASELAAYLRRRNPDWERERVERVVSAVERRRNGGERAGERDDT